VKPDFCSNEGLSTLNAETHLLAVGLLCYADDEGYFNANHRLVKAAIFPLRECSVSTHQMLTELSIVGYLRLGTTPDGKHWGHILKFLEHQRINRPTPSKIKDLPVTWSSSLGPHLQLTEASLQEGKGIRKGMEGEGASVTRVLPPSPGANGEFILATALAHEIPLNARAGDIAVLARAIEIEAAEHGGDVLVAKDFIRDRAREARAQGELVNVFWVQDQRHRAAPKSRDVYAQYMKETQNDEN
jgi:hypothetical protein